MIDSSIMIRDESRESGRVLTTSTPNPPKIGTSDRDLATLINVYFTN